MRREGGWGHVAPDWTRHRQPHSDAHVDAGRGGVPTPPASLAEPCRAEPRS